MNAAKLEAIERSLNGTARKVLNAVPIQEAWTSTEILTEIGRCSSAPDKRTFDWALQSLKEHKLIREPQPGIWIRVAPRAKLASVSIEEDAVPAPKAVQLVEQLSPMDKLGNVSSALRKMSAQLAELAEDIDEAALEMEAKSQSSNAEHEKLKQLAAVLKSLTQ